MPILSTIGGASAYGMRARSTTVAASFIEATGGTITTSGDYKYHTFDSNGTFSVTSAPSGKTIDFVLVAAGGNADESSIGCGGGGGVVVKTGRAVSVGSYALTVGTFVTKNSTGFGDTALAGGNFNTNGGSGGGSSQIGSEGAALQPTSFSGGYGYKGSGGDGGGGGAGSAGGATGGLGVVPTPFTGTYGAGGTPGTASVPTANSGNGGHSGETEGYRSGADGRVIVRYQFQ